LWFSHKIQCSSPQGAREAGTVVDDAGYYAYRNPVKTAGLVAGGVALVAGGAELVGVAAVGVDLSAGAGYAGLASETADVLRCRYANDSAACSAAVYGAMGAGVGLGDVALGGPLESCAAKLAGSLGWAGAFLGGGLDLESK
jgi:hypothetical protein